MATDYDELTSKRSRYNRQEEKNHRTMREWLEQFVHNCRLPNISLISETRQHDGSNKRTLRELFRVNCNQLMTYFFTNFEVIDSTERIVNLDRQLIRMAVKLDRYIYSTSYVTEKTCPNNISVVGSDTNQTARKTQLTLIAFHLLIEWLYVVYRLCRFTTSTTTALLRYDTGLIFMVSNTLNKNLPHPFLRLILDFDVASNVINTSNELFQQQRHNFISTVVQIIFSTLQIDYTQENVDEYIIVTSRPNKINFHLYFNGHLDVVIELLVRHEIHTYVYNAQHECIFKLDEPKLITLPMGREHIPFKFHIQNNNMIQEDENELSLETFMQMAPIDLCNFRTFGLIEKNRTLSTVSTATLNLNQIHICICDSKNCPNNNDFDLITNYPFNFHHLISMYSTSMHQPLQKLISYSEVINTQMTLISPHYLLQYDFTQASVSFVNFIYEHEVIYSIDRYMLHLYNCLSAKEMDINDNYNIEFKCSVPQEFYELPLAIILYKHYNFQHYDIKQRSPNWSQKFTNDGNNTLDLLQQLPRHRETNSYNDTTIHLSDLKCLPFTRQQCYLLRLIESRQGNVATRNDWQELEQQVYSVLITRLTTIDENYTTFLLYLLHQTNLNRNITNCFIRKVVQQLQANARFLRQRNGSNCSGTVNTYVRFEHTKNRDNEKQKLTEMCNQQQETTLSGKQRTNDCEDYLFCYDYLWLKTIMQICFNCGSVTSTISAFYRYTDFNSFFDCVHFVLQTFDLTTHAKYILSKWALMSPAPTNFMSMSFRYTDWPFCLFHYANVADNIEARQNKQFIHFRDYISSLFGLFQQMLNNESIPFADNYQDFFFRHICGLQSLGNQRLIVFYAGRFHSIYENELKNSCSYNGSSSADHYEIDGNTLNYFTFHETIGLLNPLFNIYELAAPSVQTLVGIRLHPSIPKIIGEHHLAMRSCPKFQKFLFQVYAKCKPFIDLCCENVLLVALLFPIANRSTLGNDAVLLPSICYEDESFIVLLNDFSYLQKKIGIYWNETFLHLVRTKRNLFTYYIKRFILLFHLLTQKYNCDFRNIIVFVQLLFGNGIREQIGLPRQKNDDNGIRNHQEETDQDKLLNNTDGKDNAIFEINNSDNNECLAISRYNENPSTMTEFIKKIIQVSKRRENFMHQEQRKIIDTVTKNNAKEALWEPEVINREEEPILKNDDFFRNQYCLLLGRDFSKIVLPVCNMNNDYRLTQRDVLVVLLNFDNLYCSDEAYDKLINQINLRQQPNKVLKFFVLLVSWCTRMGRRHPLSETRLFTQLFYDAPNVYKQLKKMLYSSIGPVLKFSKIDELAKLLRAYCENTVVDFLQLRKKVIEHLQMPDMCILTDGIDEESKRLKQDYPQYFEMTNTEQIIDRDMVEKLQQHTYQTFALLIVLSEFNFDVLIDYLKFVIYLLYKGNNLRICLYIYGVTQSCKSRFAEMCESIMQTGTSMSFNAVNMSKNPTQDYDTIVVPGAFNNLLIFDEIDKISISRFKTIINTATMSTRDIRGNDSLNLKLACTPLLTSNKTFSADEATFTRLHLIKKFMQFCPPINVPTKEGGQCRFNIGTLIFDRNIMDHTSEKRAPIQIGAMILTRKLPEWIPHDEAIGLYMLQHYLLPFFFHHLTTPISSHVSNTMRLTLKRYIVQNYPLSNFLENVRIDSSSEFLSNKKLYDIVNVWWNNNREKFKSSDTDCNILFNELQDQLGKFKTTKNGIDGYNIIVRIR